MIIRNGFVSNSSSSSFILIGIQLKYNKDNIKTTLRTLGFDEAKVAEIIEAIGDKYWKLGEYLPKTVLGLNVLHESECQLLYIGKELTSIADAINFSDSDVTEIAEKLKVDKSKVKFINDEINY